VPVQRQFLEYVLEQLSGLPALSARRMFGGFGLYSEGLFFGLIDDDTVFLKTDDGNIAQYQARGMPRFMPFPDRPHTALGYHQVPVDVIEDAEIFLQWARASVAVAVRARSRKTSSKPPRKPARTTPRKAGRK
jgi:DNA transformation protein and related proteins